MEQKKVPWRFSENPPFQKWEWKTKDFTAQIIDDGSNMQAFTWNIIDTTGVENKILKTAQAANLKEAQTELIEYVGKSWSREFGYSEYAGDLIYTFEISTGKKENLKEYVGEDVIITYFDETGEKKIRGIFGVKNHNTLIKTHAGKILIIPPAIIKQIDFA